jgi:hypothetical protein
VHIEDTVTQTCSLPIGAPLFKRQPSVSSSMSSLGLPWPSARIGYAHEKGVAHPIKIATTAAQSVVSPVVRSDALEAVEMRTPGIERPTHILGSHITTLAAAAVLAAMLHATVPPLVRPK